MKFPKTTKRYCPYCRKQTNQKIKHVSSGSKAGQMKRGGKARIRLRGSWRGIGNKGRYSRMKNQAKKKRKTTKKTQILYTCQECGKSKYQKKGRRTSKILIE